MNLKKINLRLSIGQQIYWWCSTITSVILPLISKVFLPNWFDLSLIIAVIIFVIAIAYLYCKIRKQNKQIAALQEKIPLMERVLSIPRFKKQRLYFTPIWRNNIHTLINEVVLSQIHVIREVVGNKDGLWKDNHATYIFEGKCLHNLNKFKFSIAGREEISISDINLMITDLINNSSLNFNLIDSDDDNIKFLEIYFMEEKHQGDHFKFQISWIWPKTVHIEYGYFSIPNIYSKTTDKLILEFIPSNDMKISVDIYKYGLTDENPQHITHVYANNEGKYIAIINNPEKNADYITSYE